MEIIESIANMRSLAEAFRAKTDKIALVPTMGYLHEGHKGIIKTARNNAEKIVVTSFVNELQFGPNEQVKKYPRDLNWDVEFCKREGVDALFAPHDTEIFPEGYSTYVYEEAVSSELGGNARLFTFKGYATLMNIFYNIIHPDFFVLGQKEAQHTMVMRKIIQDLKIPVQLLISPIVREHDKIAASTYNQFLSPTQRKDAKQIVDALLLGKRLVDDEEIRSVDRIIAETTHFLAKCLRLRVIYIAIVDPITLKPLKKIIPGESLLIVSVWVDQIRLNDNILL